MPFQIGSVAVHDDGQHTGSAKRDAANGLAGLDSNGNVLAPGAGAYFARDGTNQIILYERTSGEGWLNVVRDGAQNFRALLKNAGSSSVIQLANMKNAASGIAGLDAQSRIATAQTAAILRSGLVGCIPVSALTTVQGTWGQLNIAGCTDFDDVLVTQAGSYNNSTTKADLDEVKISNLVLNAGTYTIIVVWSGSTDTGILEVLHGAASIGTVDTYAAGGSFNTATSFTYSPTVRTSADLRFRANGKNGASSAYAIHLQRIQIRKTT